MVQTFIYLFFYNIKLIEKKRLFFRIDTGFWLYVQTIFVEEHILNVQRWEITLNCISSKIISCNIWYFLQAWSWINGSCSAAPSWWWWWCIWLSDCRSFIQIDSFRKLEVGFGPGEFSTMYAACCCCLLFGLVGLWWFRTLGNSASALVPRVLCFTDWYISIFASFISLLLGGNYLIKKFCSDYIYLFILAKFVQS